MYFNFNTDRDKPYAWWCGTYKGILVDHHISTMPHVNCGEKCWGNKLGSSERGELRSNEMKMTVLGDNVRQS